MKPAEIQHTCASFNLGLGNQATVACIKENSIVTTGPLTFLADLRQQHMTNNAASAEKYTENQTKMRSSFLAKLLGLEGLFGIWTQTPRLKKGERRALIASSELGYRAMIGQLEEVFSPYFTHLMLVVADVDLKPSALDVVQQSQNTGMPITPIVFAKSVSSNLTSHDIRNILVSPILYIKPKHFHNKTINVVKESGTGLDNGTRHYMKKVLRHSPHKLCEMHSDLTINHSQVLSLKDYYQLLFQYQLGIVATHASEMVGALTANPPSHLYLAQMRGPHEGVNGDWMAQFYDERISDIGKAYQIRHLIKRQTTEEEIADAIGHTRAMTAIDRFIRNN